MIITELNGGMGNQLFQYAVARAISYRLKLPLRFVFNMHAHDTPRPYTLGKFNTTGENVNQIELSIFSFFSKLSTLTKIRFAKTLQEGNGKFEPYVTNAKGFIMLKGFWQSQKYFINIRPLLLKDLQVKEPINEQSVELLKKIKSTNSVCIHVRRGDYVSNPNASAFHGTCSPEYYKQAIDLIKSKVKDPSFFIFSDDPDWAKENLPLEGSPCMSSYNNAVTDYAQDLRLMYNCQHFIIANSTFSWWGAWLSTNVNKIVIAPSRWFASNERNYSDLVPENWIKI